MNGKKSHDGGASNKLILVAGAAIGFFILAVAAVYFGKFHFGLSSKQDVWGQFGDYFGGVLNPILSFFAFIALLVTLIDQRESASSSEARHRTEVSDARFFQVLALLPQSISEVKYCPVKHVESKLDVYFESRAATQKMWDSLLNKMRFSFSVVDLPEVKCKRIRAAVRTFSAEVWPLTGFYFQLIYSIVDFVAKSGEAGEPGFELYMSLLKSQLTEHERLLIFYISLASDENVKHASIIFSAGFCDVVLTVDPLETLREKLLGDSMACSQTEEQKA